LILFLFHVGHSLTFSPIKRWKGGGGYLVATDQNQRTNQKKIPLKANPNLIINQTSLAALLWASFDWLDGIDLTFVILSFFD
jgi:hypothetical protein